MAPRRQPARDPNGRLHATADPIDTVERIITQTLRVRALRALKPRERRELYLHALGYSYREIAARTASTYIAVNRRISEGRAHLRRLAHEG